ncbi:LOW QUALITY PROTEIN: hypothetical protein HID58_061313, partial [Brassica napus]
RGCGWESYEISFGDKFHTIYDTRDGTCEYFVISCENTQFIRGACVIDNVIHIGLMWYDSNEKILKMVKGLDPSMGGMVDCNGELACLWQDFDVEKKIWCAMIALDKVGVEIHGGVSLLDMY